MQPTEGKSNHRNLGCIHKYISTN